MELILATMAFYLIGAMMGLFIQLLIGANADDTRPVGLVNPAQAPSQQPSATLAPYPSMRFQNLRIRINKRL